ncbi:hypothetical protein SY88_04795 [Clostridiales bacterium PH28_bin88]|nr:hypothetical protein SY88_04795 [Clostridiales bacterium PH28_bin88]
MILKIKRKIVLPVLALLVTAAAGYTFYQARVKVDPVALLDETLAKTAEVDSYRYRLEIKVVIGGREQTISQIQGEKAGGDFHIKGSINKVDSEVYQIKDVNYMRDPLTGKWMVSPGSNPLDRRIFAVEIDPLSSFDFTSIQEVGYAGKEKVTGRKTYVLTCRPDVRQGFLATWFKDFHYRLWVDRSDHRIVQAEMHGVFKENPQNTVSMRMEVWDYGADIKFTAPQ